MLDRSVLRHYGANERQAKGAYYIEDRYTWGRGPHAARQSA
jgi:hypothetical protein